MGFSNLDGSSMHCMVHFCVFSRDIGFDQPFLVPVPTFIEWVAIPFGRNVHVHVAAKIKSLRLVVCGDGHSFYDDVFDPILGRTTRLFGLGQQYCLLFHSIDRYDALSTDSSLCCRGISGCAVSNPCFSSILLVLIYIPFFCALFEKPR